jgi:hypothetical protein
MTARAAGFFVLSLPCAAKEPEEADMLKDRLNTCASLASTLVVAAVIVTGLVSLSAENLSQHATARQVQLDHSAAIHKLLFK